MHETPPPTTKPKPWWKREPFLGIPVWVFGVAVAIFMAIGVGTLSKGDDDPGEPSHQVEFCDELAKPENANLHPSDWRRIGDWTQSEMETYVTAHCPEQLSKVQD
jgi:hypothetical protein